MAGTSGKVGPDVARPAVLLRTDGTVSRPVRPSTGGTCARLWRAPPSDGPGNYVSREGRRKPSTGLPGWQVSFEAIRPFLPPSRDLLSRPADFPKKWTLHLIRSEGKSPFERPSGARQIPHRHPPPLLPLTSPPPGRSSVRTRRLTRRPTKGLDGSQKLTRLYWGCSELP